MFPDDSEGGLSVLYLVGGMVSLFVYLLPGMEGAAAMLGVVISIWQGVLLWSGKPEEIQGPESNANRPHQA